MRSREGLALAVVLCLAGASAGAQTDAQAVAPPALSASAVRAAARAVEADPLLPGKDKTKVLRFKADKDENKPAEKPDDARWWLDLLGQLSAGMRVAMWLVCAGLLIWVLLRLRDWLGHSGGSARLAALPPTHVGTLDIRPESLPDDVPAQVLALWRKGELRQALALLYRATLSRLVHDDGLEINIGATEGDCSRLADLAAKNNALSAGRLKATALATQLWLRAAYADRWPDEAAVADGCRLWSSEFDSKVAQ